MFIKTKKISLLKNDRTTIDKILVAFEEHCAAGNSVTSFAGKVHNGQLSLSWMYQNVPEYRALVDKYKVAKNTGRYAALTKYPPTPEHLALVKESLKGTRCREDDNL
jgi:hypothetical protein